MPRRIPFAHPVPAGKTDLPTKFHNMHAPALSVTGKGQYGRVLLRPQRDYPAVTMDKILTAVPIGAVSRPDRPVHHAF